MKEYGTRRGYHWGQAGVLVVMSMWLCVGTWTPTRGAHGRIPLGVGASQHTDTIRLATKIGGTIALDIAQWKALPSDGDVIVDGEYSHTDEVSTLMMTSQVGLSNMDTVSNIAINAFRNDDPDVTLVKRSDFSTGELTVRILELRYPAPPSRDPEVVLYCIAQGQAELFTLNMHFPASKESVRRAQLMAMLESYKPSTARLLTSPR
ncbi:MAG: hypothetical protein MUC47_08300 [Candidatus Kapabacteria bacterium]|nr:hypothetical protein [Candidatus Kapabacteria bacterium]